MLTSGASKGQPEGTQRPAAPGGAPRGKVAGGGLALHPDPQLRISKPEALFLPGLGCGLGEVCTPTRPVLVEHYSVGETEAQQGLTGAFFPLPPPHPQTPCLLTFSLQERTLLSPLALPEMGQDQCVCVGGGGGPLVRDPKQK